MSRLILDNDSREISIEKPTELEEFFYDNCDTSSAVGLSYLVRFFFAEGWEQIKRAICYTEFDLGLRPDVSQVKLVEVARIRECTQEQRAHLKAEASKVGHGLMKTYDMFYLYKIENIESEEKL